MSDQTSSGKKESATKPVAASGSSGSPPQKNPTPTGVPPRPPLFRRTDWIIGAVSTVLVFIGYYLTLAPDLTLEDSGELAVASYYCGVPHPPGYPVWTIYTWLFTVLVPISNIAWRVALSSAVAGALACGLLGLLVSRGSSLLLESIPELKNIDRRLENMLCMVAGFVAATLLGFNGFMWSQAVIVEVYTLSVLNLVGLLCILLRWMYAPEQKRYLYWSSFLFGLCLTTHQTLVVAAMGIEIAIMAAQPRLGRDLFLVNSAIYLLGLIGKAKGMITTFDQNFPLYVIYNFVGLGSLFLTGVLTFKTRAILSEWKAVLIIGATWFAGAAFYFYMPIASMTNPPLNWGYPRTEEGFWHALTRGQYDKTNPTTDVVRFFEQVWMYIQGTSEEFNLVYLLVGLIPFAFYPRMQKRERAWIVGLSAIYLCLAILLLILLNPSTDRQSREQSRVFFTASHVIVSIGIGYGLSLLGGMLVTQYEKYRSFLLIGAAVASGMALYGLVSLESLFAIDQMAAVFGLVAALAATTAFWIFSKRAPFWFLLGIFAVMPTYSILKHWADNEQRGHYFGYWFGHDMFTPPYDIYPEMGRNAILFGGTDPGRFNPTYMIFCESFIPPEKKPMDPKFDRRDVYLITQNALADGTYLNYIRAHYNRSTQQDPPFFQELFRTATQTQEGRTNLLARMVKPLDDYFLDLGARIETKRREKGVYPPKEILTPTPDDSARAFQEYISDAQRRLQHDMQFPNEPKQIKPGEDVRVIDNRISVSGQVAVMAINGLLTKVIFDKNPESEFYVEESFPLDWMFPYLTPFGIIMKINRQPVPEITQEMVDKDSKFWSLYSDRFIGNWITKETSIKEVCDFAERVYLRRDFKNFKGKPAFVRDDNAQKAFSKLRSAIGGVYYWRLGQAKTPAEHTRMTEAADFAFKQAFAYCPYSPEAVYKYVQLLVNQSRVADANLIVQTALKFDPENQAMHSLAANVGEIQKGHAMALQAQTQLSLLEQQYHSNPSDVKLVFQLASLYLQLQRTGMAVQIFDQLLTQTNAAPETILSVANAYAQLGNAPKLEASLQRLIERMPTNPEAWYDYSRAQMANNRIAEALTSLRKAIQLSNERLAQNPQAKNLATQALTDESFAPIRQNQEFLTIVAGR